MRLDEDVVISSSSSRRGPGLLSVVFVSAITSAVISVLTVLAVQRGGIDLGAILAGGAHHAPADQDSRVPDVNGMSADAADELLSARKLRLVVRDRRADPRIPAGAVIAQTPLAQSRIQLGGEVSVVLSTGAAHTEVPLLVGQTLDDAKKAIEGAGLKLGQVTEGNEGDPGKVTSVVPPQGAVVDPGTAVSLTVARATVPVPKLVGLKVREARAAIEKAKFVVGDVSEIYNEHKRGNLVLTQDPEGGAMAPPGSKINMVINQGD